MSRPPRLPGAAAGAPPSDGRRRYFDPSLKMHVVQVFQGDYYISERGGEVLTTVLGSCISACIRDPLIRVGGMNHFLLPEGSGSDDPSVQMRYGAFAMEQLINEILKRGGRRDYLEIKLFGGGNVVKGLSGVGHKNADFIETFMAREGFKIATSHLRGNLPRKVQYIPATGKVRMRELGEQKDQRIFQKEVEKKVRTRVAPESGSIELFD